MPLPLEVKLVNPAAAKPAPAPLVETLLRLKPDRLEPGETSVALLVEPPVKLVWINCTVLPAG